MHIHIYGKADNLTAMHSACMCSAEQKEGSSSREFCADQRISERQQRDSLFSRVDLVIGLWGIQYNREPTLQCYGGCLSTASNI